MCPGESDEALMRGTMVTGVRNNEQPDDLECQRGSTPSLARGSTRRTPARRTIPGTRSRPIPSAEVRDPDEPAEVQEPDEPGEAWGAC